MSAIIIPPGLSPMLQRAYIACQDWIDAKDLENRVGGKTPAKVIVSILRAKLEPYGESIQADSFHTHKPKKYRLVRLEEARAAA